MELRCGCYTWFGFLLPMPERLRLIRDAGFHTVCTWWSNTFSESDGEREDTAALAEKLGLYVEHAHLSYFECDNLWRDNLTGATLMQDYLSGIDAAGHCGVPTLVIHTFERRMPEDGDRKLFLSRVARLAERCERAGVRLAFENLSDWSVLYEILNSYSDCPSIGLCFDSGHANIVSPNDFSLLKQFPNRLFALHLHDNNGIKDQHLLPFQGNIDWKMLLVTLENTGYAGSLMLEASYPFDYDSADTGFDVPYSQPPIKPQEYLADAFFYCHKILES